MPCACDSDEMHDFHKQRRQCVDRAPEALTAADGEPKQTHVSSKQLHVSDGERGVKYQGNRG